jgi:hypothetical protein
MDMLIVNKDTIQNVLAFGQSELQGLIDKGNIKYTL